ncbi:MAG: hypothetical protein FJ399_01480 [Verrucomicrobia bacterium]|nr:hypothetical protein [Verrucomicrobiota bacterium]
MTLDEIRAILHNPDPFTIHMVSGRKFRIPHSDYAALGRNHTTLVFTETKGRVELIRLNQIESISVAREPVV